MDSRIRYGYDEEVVTRVTKGGGLFLSVVVTLVIPTRLWRRRPVSIS